jgi:hypothetical protein
LQKWKKKQNRKSWRPKKIEGRKERLKAFIDEKETKGEGNRRWKQTMSFRWTSLMLRRDNEGCRK